MSTKTATLLILNPVAGKGAAEDKVPIVQQLFLSAGIPFDFVLTDYPGHCTELALGAARDGRKALVLAGGDGTINEGINGLMAAKAEGLALPTLGVVPIGRGNDFAYGANVPHDLEAAVAIIAGGLSRPMDVGRIIGGNFPQGKFFGNGVGVGFDTRVGLEAAKMTWAHGFMAYVFGALKTFLIYPPAPQVTVGFNDRKITQESHQISIMNGKRMGGTFFMAPQAELGDGKLDLCMSGSLNRRSMIDLMIRYTKGTQADHPKILMDRAEFYEIDAPAGGLLCHADGETICIDGKHLRVEVLPQALNIFGTA